MYLALQILGLFWKEKKMKHGMMDLDTLGCFGEETLGLILNIVFIPLNFSKTDRLQTLQTFTFAKTHNQSSSLDRWIEDL